MELKNRLFTLTFDLPAEAATRWQEQPVVLYQMSGATRLKLEESSCILHPQDIVVVNPYTLHRLTPQGGRLVQLTLQTAAFSVQTGAAMHHTFICNSATTPDPDRYTRLREALVALLSLALSEEAAPLLEAAAAYQVMAILVAQFSGQDVWQAPAGGLAHIRNAISYIQQNFQSQIQARDIADHCHVTETYLAHIFRQALHTTPSGYLTQLRLDYALQLLTASNMPVSQIAEQAGFSLARSFNKAFRDRYGMLPRAYRAAPPAAADPVEPTDRKTLLEMLSLVPGLQNSGYLPVSPEQTLAPPPVSAAVIGTPRTDSLFRLLSFGSIDQLLLNRARETLQFLQQTFHFSSIYLTGLFEPAVLTYTESPRGIHWDFSRLDMLFDFLLSQALQPVLLLKGNLELLRTRDASGLTIWLQLVEAFLRHMTARYGAKAVGDWRCVIWTGTETDTAQILQLYQATWQSIRGVCPEMQIAGPVIEQTRELAFLEAFLQFCRLQTCEPDYFLFYTYQMRELPASDPLERELLIEPSLQANADWLARIRALIDAFYPDGRQIWIARWNSSPFDGDLLNDTPYKAANLTPLLLALSAQAHAVAYSPIMDPASPISSSEFHGGPGLISQHGIFKAPYYGFLLLHRLGRTLLASGEHYYITRSERSIQILLFHNQSFPIRIRCRADTPNLEYMIRQYPTQYTMDGAPLWRNPAERYALLDPARLHIRLQLLDLENGAYRLEESILDRAHGSAYEQWLRIGARGAVERDDQVAYLNRLSEPLSRTQHIQIENGTFLLDHILEPNEVYFAELTLRGKQAFGL